MGKPQAVLVTHEGESNPKLVGIGVAICAGSLVAFAIDGAFGGLVLLVGIGVVVAGAQKRTVPCPHCRTRISQRARTCPQCHQVVAGPASVTLVQPALAVAAPAAPPPCGSCGAHVAPGNAFCGRCGRAVAPPA